MKIIIKKIFENKNFRVLGNILWKNCLSNKKFQFTNSGRPWHGMALIEFEIIASKWRPYAACYVFFQDTMKCFPSNIFE